MARLRTLGFELNSLTDGVEFEDVAGAPSISSAIKRSGSYAGRVHITAGESRYFQCVLNLEDSLQPFYARFYLYIAAAADGRHRIFNMQQVESPFAQVVRLDINAANQLILSDEDGDIGSVSQSLELNTWHRIEVGLDTQDGPGAHIVSALINGAIFAQADNRDLGTGMGAMAFGANLDNFTNETDIYFDDIAINDGNGEFETTFPGPGSVIIMRPAGADDDSNVGFARGGSDSGSDFGQIDEVTPNDATDYLEGDPEALADFRIQNPYDIGLKFSDEIKLVEPHIRARSAVTRDTRIRIAGGAGLEPEENDLTLNQNTWQTDSRDTTQLDAGTQTITETFATVDKKDAANTNGDWDTANGRGDLKDTISNVTVKTSDSTTNSAADGRNLIINSEDVIVVAFHTFTGPGTYHLLFKKSVDRGATWTKLDGSAGEDAPGDGVKVYMALDSQDNIHCVYRIGDEALANVLYYRKLTYDGNGSYSIGAEKTVKTAVNDQIEDHSMAVDANDDIWVAYADSEFAGAGFVELKVTKSTDDGDTWSASTLVDTATGSAESAEIHPEILINTTHPILFYQYHHLTGAGGGGGEINKMRCRKYDGANWGAAIDNTITTPAQTTLPKAVKRGNDDFFIYFRDSATNAIIERFNGTAWASAQQVIATDSVEALTTNGNMVWALWTSSTSVISFRLFDGSAWEGSDRTITLGTTVNGQTMAPRTVDKELFFLYRQSGTLKAYSAQIRGVIQSIGYDASSPSVFSGESATETLNDDANSIAVEFSGSVDNSVWGAWTSDITTIFKRYIRFRVTLRSAGQTSPTIDNIAMQFRNTRIAQQLVCYRQPNTDREWDVDALNSVRLGVEIV